MKNSDESLSADKPQITITDLEKGGSGKILAIDRESRCGNTKTN